MVAQVYNLCDPCTWEAEVWFLTEYLPIQDGQRKGGMEKGQWDLD